MLKPSLLIISTDQQVITELKGALSSDQWTIQVAPQLGEEPVSEELGPPNVVILDLTQDNHETQADLSRRSTALNPSAPLLLVVSPSSDHFEYALAGAKSDFITFPFARKHVPIRIRRLLADDPQGRKNRHPIRTDSTSQCIPPLPEPSHDHSVAVAQLAGATAHELNQPLTSVITHAEFLCKKTKDPGLLRAANIIIDQADRMATIVRQIGKLTRYETKAYVGDTAIVDLKRSSERPEDDTPD